MGRAIVVRDPVSGELPSDFDLLDAWAAGDSAAGDALTRRHYDRVFRFFEVKASHMADDLTQRTFLACVEALPSFRREAGFKAFLFGIARNMLLRDQRRDGRAERAQSFSDFAANEPWTSVSRLVVRGEEHRLLLCALAGLDDDFALPLQLHYFENLRVAEIGAAMGIPTSTVTSRLMRGRQLLRAGIQRLEGQAEVSRSLLGDLDRWARALVPATDAATSGP
jgi:RNA polymerase sigma factor (sigma-70 family)